jgi:hypothetical protein
MNDHSEKQNTHRIILQEKSAKKNVVNGVGLNEQPRTFGTIRTRQPVRKGYKAGRDDDGHWKLGRIFFRPYD